MKYIKSKLLQKAVGRKQGKYLITLEVTDYDLNMLEDFATSYAPFEAYKTTNGFGAVYGADYKPLYSKYMLRMWRTFWKLWHEYDE
jgi:hypothetical protein